MRPESILETVLYADNLEETNWFYREVLGLREPRVMRDLGLVFRIDEHQVLIIFDPKESKVPGRAVPSHGARGPTHIAFRIHPQTYQGWLDQLSKHGIPIEHEQTWERTDPGNSIYFRDPSGNSIELITADIWK